MNTEPLTETAGVTAPAEPTPDSSSVADHAAQFSPEAQEEAKDISAEAEPAETPAEADQRTRDEQGRFARERQRAKNDRARPEDVPRIRKLTAQLRETERRLAEVETRTAPPKVDVPLVPPVHKVTAPASGFPEAEPTLADFEGQDDPYTPWVRAMARYDRRREAWEAEQARASTDTTARSAEWYQTADATFGQRKELFVAKAPDYQAKVDTLVKEHGDATPLLLHAILTSDKGPEIVYHLATHPTVYDEMLLLTDGKAVTEQAVALTQRQLVARSLTATTGSVAAVPYTPRIPTPPNPVRTGPLKTSDDPPAEAGSISDHARYYGTR